jgi:N-acetylmuramic acid 6-phosphate etherase
MDHLPTEARNPASMNLDELTALEFVQLMNSEDSRAVVAVATQSEQIARAIELIADRLGAGGRLIYIGAGTSGRLGVLDAAECPPTFNSPPEQVVGVIAGGYDALTRAVEGAEDHPEYAQADLANLNLGLRDVVVGIATSGRTPYVLGAMKYAKEQGAAVIALSCNPESEISALADLSITPVVGPEVLSGSTRLKAGTATKLVLNMLTTGAMVRLGKTYGNLMVDLRATNSKLRARTNRIVRIFTGISIEDADALLARCGGELKTALVAHRANISPHDARARLQSAGGQVRAALEGSIEDRTEGTAQAAREDLVIGIDGGGTHTVALLASVSRCTLPLLDEAILGRGEAGPSNLRAVGVAAALQALDEAVSQAFVAAKLPRGPVSTACFGLAGAGLPEDRQVIADWARRVNLAAKVEVTTDAANLLAAGTPENWGLAVVAGTGSIAYGQNRDGRTARAGGWGYLLGDEGSGYAIVVAALRAVVQAADGYGLRTPLADGLLKGMGLAEPRELIPRIYGGDLDRSALAAFAPLVLEAAAAGDAVANQIVQSAASALADTTLAVARNLKLDSGTIPMALCGGVLLGSADYRKQYLYALERRGLRIEPVTLVREPALGAIRLASRRLK